MAAYLESKVRSEVTESQRNAKLLTDKAQENERLLEIAENRCDQIMGRKSITLFINNL